MRQHDDTRKFENWGNFEIFLSLSQLLALSFFIKAPHVVIFSVEELQLVEDNSANFGKSGSQFKVHRRCNFQTADT